MKNLKKFLIISLLLIVYIYFAYLTLMPGSFILMEGDSLDVSTIYGVKLKNSEGISAGQNNEYLPANSRLQNNLKPGKVTLSLNLFDKIPLKEVDVYVVPKTKVIPLGDSIGLKLYTSRSISSSECLRYKEKTAKHISHMKKQE